MLGKTRAMFILGLTVGYWDESPLMMNPRFHELWIFPVWLKGTGTVPSPGLVESSLSFSADQLQDPSQRPKSEILKSFIKWHSTFVSPLHIFPNTLSNRSVTTIPNMRWTVVTPYCVVNNHKRNILYVFRRDETFFQTFLNLGWLNPGIWNVDMEIQAVVGFH